MNEPTSHETTEKHMDLCVKCGKSIDRTPRPVHGFPFPIQLVEIPPNVCERCIQKAYSQVHHLVHRPYKKPGFRPHKDESIEGRYRADGSAGSY